MKRPVHVVVVVLTSILCAAAPATAGDPGATSARAARVVVKKREHKMLVLDRRGEVIARYRVALGPGGAGPKKREGDRKTPVGHYHVTSHYPSRFKIFMGLDYPNADDRARFQRLKAAGELPKEATIGGAIGIHGGSSALGEGEDPADWTLGCVAVTDNEIVEIARMVTDGTPVEIED